MIVIKDLIKTFNGRRAVDKVHLEIKAGTIFGLVGPDGAGKTTLMRMICGLITPDAGEIILREAQLGYMPQRFSLYGDLTVSENINFFGAMYKLDRKTIRQRAKEILQLTNLSDFEQRLADNLSGGMKQKLALTCALITRPNLLILDEPTYGVDPEFRKEFWRILYYLNQEGRTIMVSTPYMDEAELCHQVAFINQGRIAVVDSPVNLKKRLEKRILEIRAVTKDPDLLKGIEEVVDFSFYGDKYHAMVTETARAKEAVETHLLSQNIPIIGIEEIPPSMEDVFVYLAEKDVNEVGA